MKIPKDITPEQIGHIKEMCEFVRQKENEARKVYFKLLDKQFELLDKKEIEAFEINIYEKLMISFFVDEESEDEMTKSDFCVNKERISTVFRTREDNEEEPTKVDILDLQNFYSNDDVFHRNHNFFLDKTHPFHGIHFCRGMYNIMNKHVLSFENIFKIDNVWIDFEVEYSLIDYHDSLLDRLPYTKKKLYLDDIRPIPFGFVGVCSYLEFVTFIEQNGLPDFISFDHDLGEEKTGYDCAKMLVEYCMDTEQPLPDFAVHSQNPVGKQNIESLLGNFRKKQNNF